jgi:hypothetical protein
LELDGSEASKGSVVVSGISSLRLRGRTLR